MNNLDFVFGGVKTYDEAYEQLVELMDSLYQLERDHPVSLLEDKTPVKTEILNEILTAYRKLTA